MRVLILCAEIGEGHLTVARALAEELKARPEIAAVGVRTSLEVLGARLGRFLEHGFHLHMERIGWSYEWAYRAFAQWRPGRRVGQIALAVLGGRALRRTISAFAADVVIVEYPVISAALGELRRLGRLGVPVCSSISDPAGLQYWAHPGIDLHLLSWAESRAEVDRIAGPGRAVAVRPLVDHRFLHPPSRPQARQALGLATSAPIVLVSGGGWGIGDLRGAVIAALAHSADTMVVCLAGRNTQLRQSLQQAFGREQRVQILGFTEQMPELLAAADALVHTTGGTTALEARVIGCPLINYGTAVAHVRAHHRAMSSLGLAEHARDRMTLGPVLARTLAHGRPHPLDVTALPEAAAAIADLAAVDGTPTNAA